MKTGRVATFVVLLAAPPACVSKARSWKHFEVADDGATTVIAGRFHASFKDGRRAKNCSVNISDVRVKFDEWGLVFMNVPPGQIQLNEIRCLDGGTPYEYGLRPYAFVTKPGGVTYFGDVVIQWQTEGGYKLSQSFGLIGALATDPKADPVTVRMQSRQAEVKEAFEQRTGRQMTWQTVLASQRLAP